MKSLWLINCIAALCALLLAGCEDSSAVPEKNQVLTAPQTLEIDGSTSLLKLSQEIVKEFKQKYPGITIENSASSSGSSIKKLISGEIDIARISRDLTSAETQEIAARETNIKAILIGYDAIVIIVHPDKYVHLKSITKQQLLKIFFEGTIKQWSQLHPQLSGTVQPYSRNSHLSGTASFFNTKVAGFATIPYAATVEPLPDTRDMVRAVMENPNAIAYTPIMFLNDRVKVLDYGESPGHIVKFSRLALQSNSYPLKRNLLFAAQTPVSLNVTKFLSLVLSQKGQGIVASIGLVPVH